MDFYSKKNCKNCVTLKSALDRAGVEYKVTILESLRDIEDIMEASDKFISQFPVLYEKESKVLLDYQEAYNKYAEPLLEPNVYRHSMYPIMYPDVYEMYKKARASYWQPEEITLKDDDFDALSADEKHFVSYILAFFAASDGIVNENLDTNFSQEISIPEVRAMYTFQMAIESIHSETYSILLDKYVSNNAEKSKLQKGITTIPSVAMKAKWAEKFMSKGRPFAERLFAFACVEGIYFSGSFCALFWLRTRNLLPGLTFSNELIARDEGLHTEFALLLYSKLVNKLSQERVQAIVDEAVENECHFINEAIPCKLIGMNADLMSQYIKFVADRLMFSAGYPKVYKVDNPFPFMEHISLQGKTNFFEKRVGEYAKASVMNSSEDLLFDLNADF